jgi:hypothetical protein
MSEPPPHFIPLANHPLPTAALPDFEMPVLLPPDIADQPKPLLDFPQDASRGWLQGANEALIVNRATLVDHDFAILAVSGDVFGRKTRSALSPASLVVHGRIQVEGCSPSLSRSV